MASLLNSGQCGKGPQLRGLFIFLGLVLLLMLTYPVKDGANSSLRLEVTHMATGRLILEIPIAEGETFQIRYTHSVDGLPVHETFLVKEGELVLDKVQWLSFGAGLGYTGQGEMILEDKWITIKNMDRRIGSLLLRVGTLADHRLIFRGEEFFLKDYADGLKLVRFSIGNNSRSHH